MNELFVPYAESRELKEPGINTRRMGLGYNFSEIYI